MSDVCAQTSYLVPAADDTPALASETRARFSAHHALIMQLRDTAAELREVINVLEARIADLEAQRL